MVGPTQHWRYLEPLVLFSLLSNRRCALFITYVWSLRKTVGNHCCVSSTWINCYCSHFAELFHLCLAFETAAIEFSHGLLDYCEPQGSSCRGARGHNVFPFPVYSQLWETKPSEFPKAGNYHKMQLSVFISLASTVNHSRAIKFCLTKGWLQNQLPVGRCKQQLYKEKESSLKWPLKAKVEGSGSGCVSASASEQGVPLLTATLMGSVPCVNNLTK